MTCKRCGTQTEQERCPYCGTVLVVQAEPEVVEQPVEVTVCEPPASPPSPDSSNSPSRPAPARDVPKLPKVSGFRIFVAAFALLLPLAYLFFDLFAKLSDVLFEVGEQSAQIFVLANRLFSLQYAANSFEEIKFATLGNDEAILEFYTPFDIFGGAGNFLLPLVCVISLCAVSAIFGLLLLFRGRRLLRRRWFSGLVTLFGVGAVFSPLFALLLLRLIAMFDGGLLAALDGGLLAADLQSRAILPTLETMLLLAILILLVLPALASLRRMSAALREESKPFGSFCASFGGRSFGFSKLMARFFLLIATTLCVFSLFFPVLVQGKLPSVSDAWQSLGEHSGSFFQSVLAILRSEGTEVDLVGMIGTVLDLVALCMPVLTGLMLLLLWRSFVRIRKAKRFILCAKKRQCRVLCNTGDRIGSLVRMPYVLHLVAQGVLVFLLSLCSGVLFHLDLGAVNGTTEQMYLLAAYVRMLCGVNTLYALFALGGALCGSIAQQYCMKMIVLSQKYCEENQQKEV